MGAGTTGATVQEELSRRSLTPRGMSRTSGVNASVSRRKFQDKAVQRVRVREACLNSESRRSFKVQR